MRRARTKIDPGDTRAQWTEKRQPSGEGCCTVLHCRLVTPMFGGGINAGEVDRQMPIRAASIRGQLRFWWRIACCEPNLPSEDVFRLERAIWGGIGRTEPTASKVRVRVQAGPVTDAQLVASDRDGSYALKYAFGPSATERANWLADGYQFQLTLRYPADLAEQIETTLRWWASFGGVGARTRRGFGALEVALKPNSAGAGPAVSAPVSSEDVQARGGVLRLRREREKRAYDAWKRAVDRIYEFRQGRGTGRNAHSSRDPRRPGRSFWPEADQIRRFTGKNANGDHLPRHEAQNRFPRAAFGMPINFEFKGYRNEPDTLELVPNALDADDEPAKRMASPLILRPYPDADHWRPAALLLPNWREALSTALRFGNADHAPARWPDDETEQRRLAALIPPMQGRGNDPLSAFMAFFMEQ